VTEGGETGVGEARLSNLKEAAEKLGGRSRFWFARLAEVVGQDILATTIWQVAARSEQTSIVL